jgi:hypothetical protein
MHVLDNHSGSEAHVLPLADVVYSFPEHSAAPVVATGPVDSLGHFPIGLT